MASITTFMRLSAHFGQWLEVGRQGRKVLRWQVAKGLIYGQVKKCYRRHKLLRVTHVMRLGTSEALQVARPRTGLFRAAEHRFYRAGESDRASWGGRSGTQQLGDSSADSPSAGSSGMVEGVLSFCAAP